MRLTVQFKTRAAFDRVASEDQRSPEAANTLAADRDKLTLRWDNISSSSAAIILINNALIRADEDVEHVELDNS